MKESQFGASTASLAGYTLDDAVEAIRALGFTGIEVLAFDGARHSIGPLAGIWLDAATPEECDRLRPRLAGFACVSTHAPFFDIPLFTHNPGIRRESLRQLAAAVEGTARIGGSLTVMHAHPKTGYSLEETWQEMVDTYRGLGDLGARCGVRVCLETMYPPTVEQFAGLIHGIDHPFVGAVIDTGHVAWTVPHPLRGTADGIALYNANLERLVQDLGPKLYHFHVHDVRPEDWRDHRQCGAGCIDWVRLCRVLDRAGYTGAFPFEFEEQDREGSLRAARGFLLGCFEAGE